MPLSLMSYTDIRLNQLLKIYLDGIPLDLGSNLLPYRTRFNFALLAHIHIHARAQKLYEHKGSKAKNVRISKPNLYALIQNLISLIKKLRIKTQRTEWRDYYSFKSYNNRSFQHKKEILLKFIQKINPETIWDLGANTGEFTRIPCQAGIKCIAYDIDPLAVELNYNQVKKEKNKNILPLILDLTNPSSSIGWNNEERMGFKQRPFPDLVLFLALIHHLAISNNVPLNKIASFLSEITRYLIIEFVPKTDSQVITLLQSRKDIFNNYYEEEFIREFGVFFNLKAQEKIIDSERTMFLMEKK